MFTKISRNYLINTDYIVGINIDTRAITLSDGRTIRVNDEDDEWFKHLIRDLNAMAVKARVI